MRLPTVTRAGKPAIIVVIRSIPPQSQRKAPVVVSSTPTDEFIPSRPSDEPKPIAPQSPPPPAKKSGRPGDSSSSSATGGGSAYQDPGQLADNTRTGLDTETY